MSVESIKLNNAQNSSDGGNLAAPKNDNYDNRFTPEGNLFEANNNDNKINVNSTHPKDGILMCAAETLPPVRRIISLPDKMDKGDYMAALGAIGLTAINFPEDIRDIKGAANQVSAYYKGVKPDFKYDHKLCQHPFSFFKGTLLHKFVDPNTTKHPEFTDKLLNADKTLAGTKFGKKILKFLNVEKIGHIETKIKKIGSTEENPIFVRANVYKGNAFGKLTARSMERTTALGLVVFGALELTKIISAATKGDTAGDKAKNATKQTAKSAINITLTTAGISYLGALGAQKLGPLGSLIGMGVGAVIGNKLSNKAQDLIS